MQGFFNIHKSINVIHHVNKLEDKNHMIVSIDVEKALDKFQHPFLIKILQKAGVEGTYLNIIKAMYINTQQTLSSMGKKLKAFLLKSETRQVPTLTTTIQHNFGSFSHSNQRRKRCKRNPDWKRRSKTLTVCR